MCNSKNDREMTSIFVLLEENGDLVGVFSSLLDATASGVCDHECVIKEFELGTNRLLNTYMWDPFDPNGGWISV